MSPPNQSQCNGGQMYTHNSHKFYNASSEILILYYNIYNNFLKGAQNYYFNFINFVFFIFFNIYNKYSLFIEKYILKKPKKPIIC